MKDYDRDADPRNRNDKEDDEFATGWQSVEIDTRPIDINSDDKAVLDDEPVVNQGLAGALQLADKKGPFFTFCLSGKDFVAHFVEVWFKAE